MSTKAIGFTVTIDGSMSGAGPFDGNGATPTDDYAGNAGLDHSRTPSGQRMDS